MISENRQCPGLPLIDRSPVGTTEDLEVLSQALYHAIYQNVDLMWVHEVY